MKQTIDGAGGATDGGIALFQSTIGAPDFNFTLNAVDQATGTPLFVNNLNDGLWHHLSADLGAAGYAGFHISSIEAGIHNGTPTGTWDVYFANVALVRADGSVYQIFAGQDGASVANISGNTAAGSRLMTSGTERIDTANDPEIANTFYLADHLGTTQMEFSAGGAPVWRGEFAPFGEELDTQVTANHYKFTGKERDAESGLDYFGARYYNSNMGRFSSPDPSGLAYADPTNPQSLNLYSYVLNNPLSYVDPNGLYCAWEDGTSDDDEKDGGVGNGKGGCEDQGGHWTNDSNPCNGADNCTATFDWNKPVPLQAQLGDDGSIAYVPGLALSVDGLNYSGCNLNAPGGNYRVGPNAVDAFQPGMQQQLTGAIQDLNSQGITPMITSGFRTGADQQRMRSGGSGGNPAAKGYSHHQEGTAADFNTKDGHFAATKAAMANQGLTWGGTFRTPDPPHFQQAAAGVPASAATVANCGGK